MDPISLIPLHFEQLRELRNGSISYVQIIKRDQTRPPVRPVCRKLGVSKLSEIASETDLYNALVYVAQNQAAKLKDSGASYGPYEDNSDSSPFQSARSAESDLLRSPRDMFIKDERDLSSVTNAATHFGGLGSHSSGLDDSTDFSGNKGNSVGGAGSGEQRLESFPEYLSLLNCMLGLRLSYSPYARVDKLAMEYGLSDSFLSAAIQYVCELCGCRHLDPTVPVDQVVNATATFFRIRVLGIGPRPAATWNRTESSRGNIIGAPSSSLNPNATGFQPRGFAQTLDGGTSQLRSNTATLASRVYPGGPHMDAAFNRLNSGGVGTVGGGTYLYPPQSSLQQPSVPEPSYGTGSAGSLHRPSPRSLPVSTSVGVAYKHTSWEGDRVVQSQATQFGLQHLQQVQRQQQIGAGANMDPYGRSPRTALASSIAPGSAQSFLQYQDDQSKSLSYGKVKLPLSARSLTGSTPPQRSPTSLEIGVSPYQSSQLSQSLQLGQTNQPIHNYSPPSTARAASNPSPTNAVGTGLGTVVPSGAPGARTPNLLPIYQQFWETAYQLFVSICDRQYPRGKTLDILAELGAVVISASTTPPPQLTHSLDITAKIACLELSKKLEPSTTHSAEQVDSCIRALSRFVVQSCAAIDPTGTPKSESLIKELQDQLAQTKPLDLPANSLPSVPESAVSAVDTVLYSHVTPALAPFGWGEVYEHIRFRLEAMMQVFQNGAAVHLHGAAVVGLNCHDSGVNLTALLPEVDMVEYNFLGKRRNLHKRLKYLEGALAAELAPEQAVEMVSQCIEKIRASAALPSLKVSMTAVMTPDELARTRAKAKLNADVELLCKFGDRYLGQLQTDLHIKRRQQPQMRALFEQLASLRTQLAEIENSMALARKNALIGLQTALTQFGYADVQIVESDHGNADKSIVFSDLDSPVGAVCCRLVVCRPLYVHTSRLMACYLKMDVSGKVIALVAIVKVFCAAHKLNIELNSYAWNILVLHFLLAKGFLPCIQDNFLVGSSDPAQASTRTMCADIDASYFEDITLTPENSYKLSSCSLFDLLIQFFHYYVAEVNIYESVVTVREHGELLPKSAWGVVPTARLWCISIEDPLERTTSAQPNDLASSVSREGQAKVFGTLRQGMFAMMGIARSTMDAAGLEDTINKLFSSEALLELATQNGYGSQINASKRKGDDENGLMDESGFAGASGSGFTSPRSPGPEIVSTELDEIGKPPGFTPEANKELAMTHFRDGGHSDGSLNGGYGMQDGDSLCESPTSINRKHPKVPIIPLSDMIPTGGDSVFGGTAIPAVNQGVGASSSTFLVSVPGPNRQLYGTHGDIGRGYGPQPQKPYFLPGVSAKATSGRSSISDMLYSVDGGHGMDVNSFQVFGENISVTSTSTSSASGSGNYSNTGLLFDWSQNSMMLNETDILGGSLMQLGLGDDNNQSATGEPCEENVGTGI